MTDVDATDFFRDDAFVGDPYPYFDEIRGRCPVRREPHHGVVMVTGYDEAVAVYHDAETFSSCNAVTGPFPGFPVPLEGDDVSDAIAAHRDELPFSDQITTMDPPGHTAHRALLMRLITPKRLKENEAFMWRLADQVIDGFAANRRCEVVREYASPFAMLVVADLLGVPEEDHATFDALARDSDRIGRWAAPTTTRWRTARWSSSTTAFTAYVEDRRRVPRDDVLTGLATVSSPRRAPPEVIDVVRIATNLFAAGQETTVRLLGPRSQLIGERADLQARLRPRTRSAFPASSRRRCASRAP